MSEKITVDLNQVEEIFLLLEELNGFFHDPDKYRDQGRVIAYVENGMYKKLQRASYTTVWNWLPLRVQKEMEDRPSPFEQSNE